MRSFLMIISFLAVILGSVLVSNNSFNPLGWILGFCGIIEILYFIAKRTKEDFRRIKETRTCPTCNGSGMVEKEERNNSGLIN